MIEIKSIHQSRSVDGGHAIELDFTLDDGSIHTLKMPYERIAHTVHAITSAAAVAESAQKVGTSGKPAFAVIAPYRVSNVRTGVSPDGVIVAEFATPQGPVQVAMTTEQTRWTIERLTAELANHGKQRFPKLS
jgi:hypothetical protein